MKALPLRIRLAAWYFSVLACTFVIFGAAAVVAMRRSINTTVDEQLRDRVEGIRQVIKRSLPEGRERMEHELGENAEVEVGGSIFQVSDDAGRWVYRSPSAVRYGALLPAGSKTGISTMARAGTPLRMLSATVTVDGKAYRVQVVEPMDDFYEAMERFQWVLILSGPLLLLVASLGGYWISRRALTPVDQMIREAQRIGAKNLSSRLAVPQSRDEMQRLAETLNGMLERLDGAFKRITQFTADASHELRTPVALMRTRAELSLRKPRSEAEYHEALGQILKELETASDLIERLMLLARADSGTEAIQLGPLDLTGPAREAWEEGRTLAEAKQISLLHEIPREPVWIEGDFPSLRRLFLILIDNAVKYTPPQGQVKVSVSSRDGWAVAEVSDTGIGIGPQDLPHVFERFYRADKARTRESGGTGLGLSIGRWIAEAHGGTIEAQSAPGEGSQFRVRISLISTWGPSV